ncbi:hypothetical protein phiAS5_ORF0161 [Aeromonas phage phiAS5]|uniref:Uncharacterized protein n=1 Tax=Aeromonas phage phiAS5 TaxID=879630 RepID=E1A2Q8_9CAUD|nr:hypothetical protein phiAS5_ORF0161 [Aeromonas phage phiAS5]ADM80004.1 hypothetical protein phiAS5_ORF0161 [Aeromonas phage phiAS5]BES53225.1 hypothetical protein [Aeromonas phage phiWae14]
MNTAVIFGNICNSRIVEAVETRKKTGLACDPKWLDEQVEWMHSAVVAQFEDQKWFKFALREHLVAFILKEYGAIAFGVDNGI